MNIATLQNGIWDWIEAVTSYGNSRIIWENQKAQRPQKPYISLLFSTITKIGHDWHSAPATDGSNTIRGDREIILQISHYGTGSLQVINDLEDSLERNLYLDILRENGIAYAETVNNSDISLLLDEIIEERAILEVLIRTNSTVITDIDEIGVIETVNVPNAKYYDSGENLKRDNSFTIPQP